MPQTVTHDEAKLRKQSTFDGVDSDDDKPFDEVRTDDITKTITQGSDKTTELLDSLLGVLPTRFVPRKTISFK